MEQEENPFDAPAEKRGGHKYRYYIGIDPGKTGGIAVIDSSTGELHAYDIPRLGSEIDPRGILEIYQKYTSEPHLFALEDVHALGGIAASSNWSLAHSLGIKEAMLYAANASFIKVAPKKWQSIAWQGVPVKRKTNGKTDTKATSFIAAARLFPNHKFLKSKDGQIDAALMAKYLELTT